MLSNLQAKNPSPDTILRDTPPEGKFRHPSFARRPFVTAFGLGSLACMLNCFKFARYSYMTKGEVIFNTVHLFIYSIDQDVSGGQVSHCIVFSD